MEKIDADSAKPTIVAPVKDGLRNSERSSSGSAARRSTTTNSTSSSAQAAKQPMISALPQPSSLPRISAYTSRKSAGHNSATARRSTPAAAGSRDSRNRSHETTSAASPIGTLTRKIQRHDS